MPEGAIDRSQAADGAVAWRTVNDIGQHGAVGISGRQGDGERRALLSAQCLTVSHRRVGHWCDGKRNGDGCRLGCAVSDAELEGIIAGKVGAGRIEQSWRNAAQHTMFRLR